MSCVMFGLTQSVREDLQALNPLIIVKLQAVNAVKAIVLYQIERRVHGDLVGTNRILLFMSSQSFKMQKKIWYRDLSSSPRTCTQLKITKGTIFYQDTALSQLLTVSK